MPSVYTFQCLTGKSDNNKVYFVYIKPVFSCRVAYWIIAAREEIIEWEKQCAFCKRRKAKDANQLWHHYL